MHRCAYARVCVYVCVSVHVYMYVSICVRVVSMYHTHTYGRKLWWSKTLAILANQY